MTLYYAFRVGPSLTSIFNDAILQSIESCAREYAGPGNSSILAASVNFVDLAGSERASQILSAGTRLKEGCHINRSLLTLGTVIRKLSKGGTGHIPYRDSKLTRILQNTLGGNARTAIICTMSPERVHVEQSRNTLLFANCAKQVRTNAHVNSVTSDKALVKQLQRELAILENEMRSLGSSSVKGDTADVLREKEQLIGKMAKEIEVLTWQRDLAQSRVANLLLSVREVQMLKQSSNSSEVAKAPCIVDSSKHEDTVTPSANNEYLGLAENPEENFLLDGMTPKFLVPEPCKGWEVSEKLDQEFEDSCKDVQCVEIEDSINTMDEQEGKLTTTEVLHQKTGTDESDDFSPDPEEKQGKIDMVITTNTDVVSSPEKEDLQSSPVYNDETYKALKQKIQELQRTVNFLINTQHQDQSPSFSHTSSSCGRNLGRSQSCRAVVTTVPSSAYFEKTTHNQSTPPSTGVEKDFLERSRHLHQMLSEVNYDNRSENISSRHSRTSSFSGYGYGETLNLKDLDMEDTSSETNFHPPPWKPISDDPSKRISTSTASAAGGSETKQLSEKQIDNKVRR
ncbi:kinesin-like protein KIN-7I [Hibiscus syriacus]|uniref:kinesin-like protein KIN-7I n=1 Tax=Hibiscus syriacus TaxID=106335 RepID=UPI0019224639|nr:kinesin-like protein KIN-7I [Hibiscus syriacus]